MITLLTILLISFFDLFVVSPILSIVACGFDFIINLVKAAAKVINNNPLGYSALFACSSISVGLGVYLKNKLA